MNRLALISALFLSLTSLSSVQAQDASQAPAQTMYATSAVNIRSGAGTNYNAIGRVPAGQPVQIAGPAVGGFYPLTTGGYVDANLLSANQVKIVHIVKQAPAPDPAYAQKPVAPGFKPGDCAPYSRVINIAGQAPQEVRGTACLQVDGTWRIVNGNAPGMQVPAPEAPVPPPQPGQPIYQTQPGQPLPPGAVPVPASAGLPWQR